MELLVICRFGYFKVSFFYFFMHLLVLLFGIGRIPLFLLYEQTERKKQRMKTVTFLLIAACYHMATATTMTSLLSLLRGPTEKRVPESVPFLDSRLLKTGRAIVAESFTPQGEQLSGHATLTLVQNEHGNWVYRGYAAKSRVFTTLDEVQMAVDRHGLIDSWALYANPDLMRKLDPLQIRQMLTMSAHWNEHVSRGYRFNTVSELHTLMNQTPIHPLDNDHDSDDNNPGIGGPLCDTSDPSCAFLLDARRHNRGYNLSTSDCYGPPYINTVNAPGTDPYTPGLVNGQPGWVFEAVSTPTGFSDTLPPNPFVPFTAVPGVYCAQVATDFSWCLDLGGNTVSEEWMCQDRWVFWRQFNLDACANMVMNATYPRGINLPLCAICPNPGIDCHNVLNGMEFASLTGDLTLYPSYHPIDGTHWFRMRFGITTGTGPLALVAANSGGYDLVMNDLYCDFFYGQFFKTRK